MAIIQNPLGDSLRLSFQIGMDLKGNPLVKTQIYRNLKPGAPDLNVYTVAQVLGGLQRFPVNKIQRNKEILLVQE